jgi:lipoprotein-releasing system permease protein
MSRNSDGFVSLITWVSVCGVALGVMALTVVTNVINGFEGELSRVIAGVNGEVLLYTRGELLPNTQDLRDRVLKADHRIQAITPSLITELMTSGSIGVAGTVLEGVDLDRIGEVTSVASRIRKGRLPKVSVNPEALPEVVLGEALAEKIGATPGDEVRLITPLHREKGSREMSPQAVRAQVVGIVALGMYEYDSKYAYMALSEVQKMLGMEDEVSTFKMKLKPGSPSRKVAEKLGEQFGYPFRAKDWSALNRNLLYAIELEKVVIAIILTFILLVAAFNVLSTLMMMIHDKTKEIAILKAMGFRSVQSFRLFVWMGSGIGLVGTAVGLLAGLGLSELLARTQWIKLPPQVYYIGYLPVTFRWVEIAVIGCLALLITFLSTLYPAYQVSTRSPMDGIRYES